MVPLMINTAFKTPSKIALPIPNVNTPKSTLPTTLPLVTMINYVIALEIGLLGAFFLIISNAHLI